MPSIAQQLTAAVLVACSGAAAAQAPAFIYSPYQHLAQKFPTIVDGKRTVTPGALTWAFATGECGREKWGRHSAQRVADRYVAALVGAGVDYLVSTGGQGGVFTCATDEGMERFISRYDSKHLIGLDFDIEAGQSVAQVDSLVQRIKAAQLKRPHLRYSFTVATHAASDGSRNCLNQEGEAILAALNRYGVREFTLNLMVMNYGPGKPGNCVLNATGGCAMGRSAIQAARNVHEKYKLPYAQIELTAMIGINDVVSNVFTLDDARMVNVAARQMKLAGLHYWSLDRDQPCKAPVKRASALCSSLPITALAYHRILSR